MYGVLKLIFVENSFIYQMNFFTLGIIESFLLFGKNMEVIKQQMAGALIMIPYLVSLLETCTENLISIQVAISLRPLRPLMISICYEQQPR